MAEVRCYDTLSREIRPLRPADGKQLGMYVCGPTVYGPAHIGNFITFVRFDLLFRLLKAAGKHPHYVRNITDVDDKTIRGSLESKRSLTDFTREWTQKFHRDCQALNLLPPDDEPRATDHIEEQIAMVEKLIAGGFAYQADDGSVYYQVKKFSSYGKLSHFDPEALRSQDTNSAGRQNLADEYDRESVADFALWKAWKPDDGDVAWDSPWGRGRPGWHLECSAMSMKYLGDTFDLHGGGEDLCFPHHENEIAQSEAATGKPFCHHWVHGVHLLVEGKKMSKSLGNFFTLDDLIEKGFEPRVVRLAMLGGHYRQQFNFTLAGLDAAKSALEKIEKATRKLLEEAQVPVADWENMIAEPEVSESGSFGESWAALCNDLNTPAALGALHKTLRDATKAAPENLKGTVEDLASLIGVLGIELNLESAPPASTEAPAEIQELAQARWDAKQTRDWPKADALRSEITNAGWKVLDRKDGFDLEPL